jgi:hypothetical protein
VTEAHLRVRGDRLEAYFADLGDAYTTVASRAEALRIDRSTYWRAVRGKVQVKQSFIAAVVEFFTDQTAPPSATEHERGQVRGTIFADLFETVHDDEPEPAAVTP